jgi:hypothetical protein
VVSRGIDNIKKERGEITSTVGSLRMKAGAASRHAAAARPPQTQITYAWLI